MVTKTLVSEHYILFGEECERVVRPEEGLQFYKRWSSKIDRKQLGKCEREAIYINGEIALQQR